MPPAADPDAAGRWAAITSWSHNRWVPCASRNTTSLPRAITTQRIRDQHHRTCWSGGGKSLSRGTVRKLVLNPAFSGKSHRNNLPRPGADQRYPQRDHQPRPAATRRGSDHPAIRVRASHDGGTESVDPPAPPVPASGRPLISFRALLPGRH